MIYIGINPRWQLYTFLPRGINVMYSAAGFRRKQGWDYREWPKGCGLKFLDCGGFTALNKWGDYPWTVPSFLCLVARLRPDYWATMDYPCEPDISRGSLLTNRERIEATVRLAGECLSWADQVPGQAVPVIQGYTLEEYKLCLNLHGAAGTIREYMAVGSMCRRISTMELHELIPGIQEYAKSFGVERLHWFGLKLDPALTDLHLYSRDTAVALDDYGSWLNRLTGRRYPRGQWEKEIIFAGFLRRLDSLGLQYITREWDREPRNLLEIPGWLWQCMSEADWRSQGELDRGLMLALEEEVIYERDSTEVGR